MRSSRLVSSTPALKNLARPSFPAYNIVMAPDNFQNALKQLQQRQPFRPFTVELVSGDRFEVDYPDALGSRNGVAVFIGPGGGPVLFDHQSVSQLIGERNTAA